HLNLTGFAQGDVLYTNGAAPVSQATGSSNQVLHGGTTPSFSQVDLTADVTGILPVVSGGSPFEQGNGSIFERISNQDLLLGSNATNSAKFAFINVNSGTPTASISAGSNNAIFLTVLGNLGTTNSQSLTLDGSSTGKIVLI